MIHFITRGWQSNGNNLFSSLGIAFDLLFLEVGMQSGVKRVWETRKAAENPYLWRHSLDQEI